MKTGLGKPYDDVSVLPTKLRAYIDLTKPASSVGVAGGAFLASLLYFAYVGGSTWPNLVAEKLFSIIYVSVTVLLAHGASQVMNMAEDAEMDRHTEHKKNRPIPAGEVTEDEARSLAWVLVFLAVSRAYLVSSMFGVFMSVLVMAGIFYNLSPIRAKERIISIPWQAASRGLLIFPTVWAAYGDPFAPFPWAMGLFMFFYVLGFQNSADIIDRKVDEEYGIRTFVVEFGVRNTVLIAFGSVMAMYSVLAFSISGGFVPLKYGALVVTAPFALYMASSMWHNPYKVSETTGNHPAWLWFYVGMVLNLAVPFAVEALY